MHSTCKLLSILALHSLTYYCDCTLYNGEIYVMYTD